MAQIYYQRDAQFMATRVLVPDVLEELNTYIHTTKQLYSDKSNQGHSFFWTYDESRKSIVVDETTVSVSNDIRDQLIQLATWCFNKGYRLKGHFYLRLPDSIEYIYMDGISKLVKFFVLIDNMQLDETSVPDEIAIMDDAKKKIAKYIRFDQNKKFGEYVSDEDESDENPRPKSTIFVTNPIYAETFDNSNTVHVSSKYNNCTIIKSPTLEDESVDTIQTDDKLDDEETTEETTEDETDETDSESSNDMEIDPDYTYEICKKNIISLDHRITSLEYDRHVYIVLSGINFLFMAGIIMLFCCYS